MIKSIRGLKWYLVFILMMSFCCVMEALTPKQEYIFLKRSGQEIPQSLINKFSEQEQIQLAIESSFEDSSDDETYKQFVLEKDYNELDNQAQRVIGKQNWWEKKGILPYTQKQLDLLNVVKIYDQKNKKVKFSPVKSIEQHFLSQLPGLYQGYPGLNKLYGHDSNVLCGFYASYFLSCLFQFLIEGLNNRDSFNAFLHKVLNETRAKKIDFVMSILATKIAIDEKKKNCVEKNLSKEKKEIFPFIDHSNDYLYFFKQLSLKEKIKLIECTEEDDKKYLSLELAEDELEIPLKELLSLKHQIVIIKKPSMNAEFTTYPENQIEQIIIPFFKKANVKSSLGIIINAGITKTGFYGHWIAATVKINENGGIDMVVVDPKNVDRLDGKDRVVPALFNYLIKIYEKNTSIKKIQPIKKEDSLLTLTKLLQALKEKLVNLLTQIYKLTTLSN